MVALDIHGADRPYLNPAVPRGPDAGQAFEDPARRHVVVTAGAPYRVAFATDLIGAALSAAGRCVMTGYADFEEFVIARRGALLRTAYLLTGNHHDAEDLVQSVLVKVVAKWGRIRTIPSRTSGEVLARESASRWRGRRWREVTTETVPEAAHNDGIERTDHLALLDDLRKLSPRQRAVLVLRYFDDLTEADTAAALGISVGTVKSHAHDGLARLRNQHSGEEQSAATTGKPTTDHVVFGQQSDDGASATTRRAT